MSELSDLMAEIERLQKKNRRIQSREDIAKEALEVASQTAAGALDIPRDLTRGAAQLADLPVSLASALAQGNVTATPGGLAANLQQGPLSRALEQGLQSPLARATINTPVTRPTARKVGNVGGGGGLAGLARGGASTLARGLATEAPGTIGAAAGVGLASEAGAGPGGELLAGVAGGGGAVASQNISRAGGIGPRAGITAGRALLGEQRALQEKLNRAGELPLAVGAATSRPIVSTIASEMSGIPGTVTKVRQLQLELAKKAQKMLRGVTGVRSKDAVTGGNQILDIYKRWRTHQRATFDGQYNSILTRIGRDTEVNLDSTRSTYDQIIRVLEKNPEFAKTFSLSNKLVAQANFLRAKSVKMKVVDDRGNPIFRKEPPPTVTMEELMLFRSTVGDALRNRELVSDIPTGRLKAIYRGLTDDIERAVAQKDQSLLPQLKNLNSRYANFIGETRILDKKILKFETEADKVWQNVMGKRQPDAQLVNSILAKANPDERRQIVGIFLNRMGRPNASQGAPILLDDEGVRLASKVDFNINTFMRRYIESVQHNDALRRSLFGKGGYGRQYANDLDDLTQSLGLILENAEILANPSGTALKGINATAIWATLGAIPTTAVAAATGGPAAVLASVPAGMAAGSAGGMALGKLMLNPQFVKWFARVQYEPISQLPGHVARLGARLSQNPEVAEEWAEFEQRLRGTLTEFGDEQGALVMQLDAINAEDDR